MSGFRYRRVNAAPWAAFLYPRALSGALLALLLAGCEPSALSPPTEPLPGVSGPPRSIGDVQGSGARSPYEGQTVTVQGVSKMAPV